MKYKILSSLTLGIVLLGSATGLAQAAGSAAFSLSPNSGIYSNGTNFSVSVYENGSAVNVVTAKLTYDSSKLVCLGIGSNSSFASTVQASCSNGTVTISRYTNPGTTIDGSALVGTINFQAAASSGSALVNFAAGSQIASGGQNIWNGSTTGGAYTLTAPTQPGQGGTTPATTPAPAVNGTKTTPSANEPTTNNTISSTSATSSTGQTANTPSTKPSSTKVIASTTGISRLSWSNVWIWVGVLAVVSLGAIGYRFSNRSKDLSK